MKTTRGRGAAREEAEAPRTTRRRGGAAPAGVSPSDTATTETAAAAGAVMDRMAELKPDARDRIARRAYEIYLTRRAAGRDGDDLADWLEAEREILGRNGAV